MNLFQSRIVRYIITGGLSFAIELSVLLTLVSAFGLHRTAAVGISFWISLVVSFALQKILAFNDRRRKTKILLKQALVFGLLVLFNYLFTIFLVGLLPDEYLVLSRTLAILIVSTWNYFIYKNFIFNQHFDKSSHTLSLTTLASRKTYMDIFEKYIASNRTNIYLFITLSSGVVLFFWQYIATGGKTFMGDFDYYSQLYEAFRISVLKYGQFPAWNPWLAGGIPLWQNPQFGLISIQSLLVLPFGSILGLKLAYICYGLAGFWGLYVLSRKTFSSTKLRAALVSFIWVFCGFYTGHLVGHFTFTSFFLFPWLVFFLLERDRLKYSWLGLGGTMALITLSSFHYATLFMPFVISMLFVALLFSIKADKNGAVFNMRIRLSDIYFVVKSALVFLLLAGWQFIATYRFVAGNERVVVNGFESYLTPGQIVGSLFLPYDSILTPPKTTWGWGEYSMYIGFATLIAVILIIAYTTYTIAAKRSTKDLLSNRRAVLSILAIGLICATFAPGDFSQFSPFHLLHQLPGFAQTRVPSRWIIFTVFALLILLASWKKQLKVINLLLVISVIELFITFGPLHIQKLEWRALPERSFSSQFSQHDNDYMHHQEPNDIMNFYWYTTSQNIGQIYADDSLINTLSSTPLLESSRCAENTDSSCSFVRTENGVVNYWSPNRIVIDRTGPGEIKLNMNVESGWLINGSYLYANQRKLEPKLEFILPDDGSSSYKIDYAPKLSPKWIGWKLSQL